MQAPSRLLTQGFVVQILNPKVALLFLSFWPQFVDLKAGHATAQIIVLGFGFIALGFVTGSAYAIFAGRIGKQLRRGPRAAGIGKWITGLT